MKALTIVGNRPQFIKAAPLSLALADAGIEEVSIHSGQHYDAALSEVFYKELGLREPSHSLDLRTADVDVLESGITAALQLERPDWVIVYGDTNTTLAGARAGVRAGVALAHIEAGLRSGRPLDARGTEPDRGRPRRRPAALPRRVLARDDESRGRRRSGGSRRGRDGGRGAPLRPARQRAVSPTLTPRYLIVTLHREANVNQRRLSRIVEGLNSLTEPVLFPVHPRTRAAPLRFGPDVSPHISFTSPLGYLEFAALASQAQVPPDTPVLYGHGHASERVAEALVGTVSRR